VTRERTIESGARRDARGGGAEEWPPTKTETRNGSTPGGKKADGRTLYLPITTDLVRDLIELLQEHLARLNQPQGTSSEAYAYDRLMAGTSCALTRLLAVRAQSEWHGGASELLHMVEHFLDNPSAAEHLDAMARGPGDRADVIDALLSLAHKRQEHQPAPAHAP
jgi:hypothetical protein